MSVQTAYAKVILHPSVVHSNVDDVTRSITQHYEPAQASLKSTLTVITGKGLVLLPTAVVLVSQASKLVKANVN